MPSLPELDALITANPEAFYGIAGAYQILIGGVPTIDGFTYLINNATETNYGSFNSAIEFNQENVFINTMSSLVQGSEQAQGMIRALIADHDTLEAQVLAMYDAFVPLNAQDQSGREFLTRPEALEFYKQVAAERGTWFTSVEDGVLKLTDGAAVVALASIANLLLTIDMGIGDGMLDLRAAIHHGSAVFDAASFTPMETADGGGFDADDPYECDCIDVTGLPMDTGYDFMA